MESTTLQTYTSAQTQLAANKRNNNSALVTWNAGDGFTGNGYWCAQRKRIITSVITSSGHQIF
jgi:hypothetical protein